MNSSRTPRAPRSRFQPELWLVVGLPVSAVVASMITLAIALSHGWSASDTRVDRFGRPVATQAVTQP